MYRSNEIRRFVMSRAERFVYLKGRRLECRHQHPRICILALSNREKQTDLLTEQLHHCLGSVVHLLVVFNGRHLLLHLSPLSKHLSKPMRLQSILEHLHKRLVHCQKFRRITRYELYVLFSEKRSSGGFGGVVVGVSGSVFRGYCEEGTFDLSCSFAVKRISMAITRRGRGSRGILGWWRSRTRMLCIGSV